MAFTFKTTLITLILSLVMAFPAFSQSTPGHDATGKGTSLYYTCRLKTGEVIETNNEQVAKNSSLTKARVFAERTKYEPLSLNKELPKPGSEKELQSLHEVIEKELLKAAEGWKMGTDRTIEVKTKEQSKVPEKERRIRLARVKTTPKEIRYAKETFEEMTGGKPEVDEVVYLRREIRGKVVSVEKDEILVRFEPAIKEPVKGPFGTVTVKDRGDHYSIEIDAREGRLVRVGPLVGRIAEVDKEFLVLDFGHAFGGQTLFCEVQVKEGLDEPSDKTEARQKIQELPKEAKEKLLSKFRQEGAQEDLQFVEQRKGPQVEEQKDPPVQKEDPNVAQKGDLVEISYTASLKTGEIFLTTETSVAEDPAIKKVDWYEAPAKYASETIVVGSRASIPGLGDAIDGLRAGESKKVSIPPEKAYGLRDNSLIKGYERVKSIETTLKISAAEYVKRFGGFPVKDKTFPFNLYIMARVVEVGEKTATLELTPKKEKDESEIGTTEIRVVDDKIRIELTPKIGAPFRLKGKTGRIVSSDSDRVTVDFNSPLAGKAIVLDVKLVSLCKASTFKGKEIAWIEDHDKGLGTAAKEKKPVVLVLYADWCSWSKRLLNESLQDPRIKMLNERFVWIKVDSNKEKDLKDFYEQKGFPMIVLMDPDGEVIKSLPGFQDPRALQQELRQVIENPKAAHEGAPQTGIRGHAAVAGMVR